VQHVHGQPLPEACSFVSLRTSSGPLLDQADSANRWTSTSRCRGSKPAEAAGQEAVRRAIGGGVAPVLGRNRHHTSLAGRARERLRERFEGTALCTNLAVGPAEVWELCRVDDEGPGTLWTLLRTAMPTVLVSASTYARGRTRTRSAFRGF